MLISISILFLWQKLERKTLSLLTLTSNRICSRFSAYGKDKVSFRYRGKGPLRPGTGAGLGEDSSLLLQILLADSIQKYRL